MKNIIAYSFILFFAGISPVSYTHLRTRVGDVRIEDCLNPLDFKEWIDGQDLVMSDGL